MKLKPCPCGSKIQPIWKANHKLNLLALICNNCGKNIHTTWKKESISPQFKTAIKKVTKEWNKL